MMFELTNHEWLIVMIASLFLGVAKAGMAGMGILIIPIFAAIFPAQQSVGILLPMLIAGDILAVAWYYRGVVWRTLLQLLPIAMLGILGGFFIMRHLTIADDYLRPLIGVIVLLVLALSTWMKWRARNAPMIIPSGKSALLLAIFFGLLGGLSTMMANAAGPIFVLYLLCFGMMKKEFVGTNALLLLLLNCFKVPFQWALTAVTSESLWFNAKTIPFIFAGFLLGSIIVKRLSLEKFDVILRLLTAIAAIHLII